jgi:hypothetical protein
LYAKICIWNHKKERKREMKKNVIRKTIASLLTAAMCISICTEFTANAQEAIEVQELSASNLSNPRIEKDPSMGAG